MEVFAPNSDRLFRALIEHSPEAIALLTPEGSALYASPSIERVLGYTPKEFIAFNGFAIIHPDDVASLAQIFQHLLSGPGLIGTVQIRYRHKHGNWRWMEATITNLLHEPDVRAFMMNIHDISERKQVEEVDVMTSAPPEKEWLVESAEGKHREESEQRFRLLADNAPVMIWTSGIDKLCTYFNAPWLAFTGRTMEQELGNGWAEGVHPADMQRCLDIYTTSFDARKPFSMEYRLRRFDGEYRWILDNGVPFYASDGTFTGYIGSCIDITERRALEQQLQYSELKLRSLVEANILGVVVVDMDGRIYESNDCFAQLFGYSTDELLADTFNWSLLIPPESHEALWKMVKPFLSKAILPPFEWEYLRKDGSLVPILAMATPLDDEHRFVLVVTLDMSDRKAAVQRKQQFLRMVNHELRTPLTAILGLIELTLRDIKRRPKSLMPYAEELFEQIDQKLRLACRQVDIETRLVGDLLEVSQLEMHQFSLSLRLENIVALVEKTTLAQQEARSRNIEMILPPVEIVPVMVDADRIGQALTNYLTNALKFAPTDQIIMVKLEVEEDRVRVEVQDKGPGLTLEQQQRVWEQFYQVATHGYQGSKRGLGLGLAIAKAIIEQHHGEVGVESVPGQGAAFWFSLPLAEELIPV
jgi:PAS domain S-box-containing protein